MACKLNNIPTHIAIIMDGNGRWAKRRGLPRNAGHRKGAIAVENIINACKKFGIKYCTFFAFSTENWKRSEEEINGLYDILRDYLSEEDKFIKNNIKVQSIGVLNPFPEDLKQALERIKKKTIKLNDLTVTFALNYGGRDDMIRAVNSLMEKGNKVIDEKMLLNNLDTLNMPEPDLVIRTSGEQRISNFLLYQMAYSELYFTKTLWPDFNERHLFKALLNYQKRNRRYGGVK